MRRSRIPILRSVTLVAVLALTLQTPASAYCDTNLVNFIDAVSRLFIESELSTLTGENVVLTASQDTTMDGIRQQYFNQCQSDPSFTDLNEVWDAYKEQLVLVHLENTYRKYGVRVSGFYNQIAWILHWLDAQDLIIVSPEHLAWDAYTDQADRLAANLRREFRDYVRKEACAARSCSDSPEETDIHQALFWAFLAYESESHVSSRVANGLTASNVYSGSELLYYEDLTATLLPWPFNHLAPHNSRAMVAILDIPNSDKKDILIGFRGTNPLSGDTITDAELLLEPHDDFNDSAVKVHHGFLKMWQAHRTNILSILDGYLDQDNRIDDVRKIYVTGHSLGAAVSTVALPKIAMHLEEHYELKDPHRLQMINFGSPRTGNEAWVGAFRAMRTHYSYARVWNNPDIVAAVPLESMGYRHIDSSVELPHVPGAPPWPSNWYDRWLHHVPGVGLTESVVSAIQSALGLSGKDVLHHSAQAYQYNAIRHLVALPITAFPGDYNLGFHVPELCVGYAKSSVKLYDTDCYGTFHFACERVDSIHFGSDNIGGDAVTWDSTWLKSNSLGGYWSGPSACPPSYQFSMPSRQEDLQALDPLLIDSHETIWVDHHHSWMW